MHTKRNYASIVVILLCPLIAFSQKPNLDAFIKQEMDRLHLPGFEAVAIDNGEIVWTGYYGYQNLEKQIPVTSQSIFEAASTSKTVTAAALMQLCSAGKFKLDDDINNYLDFRLVNPRHPTTPITFRQLLQHRSSIDDNVDYLSQFWETNHGDPTIPLKAFIRDYFSVTGTHYSKEKNFHEYAPGTKANYSNMGIALLGYLAERITGEPFETYCKVNLFKPLDMTSTGWFLRDVDSTKLAMPYSYSDSLQRYKPWGYGGFPDYPAGSLHTNVEQFAHFLIAWTQDGKWHGTPIFDSTAIQTLTPDGFTPEFHLWFQYITRKGSKLYMHTGKANGVSSFISYNPADKKGLIFICNGDIEQGKDWREVIDTLYEQAF